MSHKTIIASALVALMGFGVVGCDQSKKADTKEEATSEAPKTTGEAPTETAEAPKTEAAKLPFTAKGPVATIDGKEVPAAAFNEEVERLVAMVPMLPPQAVAQYKEKVLDNVISKQIIDDAVASAKIEVAEAEVNAEYDKFAKRLEESSPGGLAAFYQKAGTTEAKLKDEIKQSLQVKQLLAKDHDVLVSEADAKANYETNAKMFDRPERVQARHILLKLDEKADDAKAAEVKKKADEIAKEAKAEGADFAALATKHSEGPTAPRGGDLGFFEKGRMVPEFEKVAYSLKPGQVSDPVRTQFGWHIIKVEAHEEAGKVPFDEVKDMIVAQLEQQKMREAMGTFLEKQKAAVKVEQKPENIEDNPEYGKGQQGGAPMFMPGGHPPMGGGQGKPMKLQMPTPAPAGK